VLYDEAINAVANVEEGMYTSLQAAINAALDISSMSVKLLSDADGNVAVEEGHSVNVTLNNHRWEAHNTGKGTIVFTDYTPIERTLTATVTSVTVPSDSSATRYSSDDSDGTKIWNVNAYDIVTMDVKIDQDYYGADIVIRFDKTVLKLTKEPGGSWSELTDNTVIGTLDTENYTYYRYLVADQQTEPLDGGVIGTFTFEVIAQADLNKTAKIEFIETHCDISVGEDGDSAKVTALSDSVNVGKITVPIPVAIQDKHYNAQKQFSGLTETNRYTVTDEGGVDVNATSQPYTVTLTLTDSNLYQWADVEKSRSDAALSTDGTALTLDYNIIAAINNDWIVAPHDVTIAYDTTFTSDVSAKYGDVTITYKSENGTDYKENAPTAVGTYTATYSVAESGNYNGLTETKVNFTITKADAQITEPTLKTELTANGTEQKLIEAGTAPDGATIYYTYTTDGSEPADGTTGTTDVPTATDAGTYYVWYRVSGGDNYKDTEWTQVGGPLGQVTISDPKFEVVVTEYIKGYQMVYVFTTKDAENVRFTYNGKALYDISTLGYKLYKYSVNDVDEYVLTSSISVNGTSQNTTQQTDYTIVYALLLESGETYDASKLSVVGPSTPTTSITLRNNETFDVDARSTSDGRAVSVNDEVQVMGAYNIRTGYTTTYLRNTFRADTNKDGVVNVLDAKGVREHYSTITSE
jgi:hypothetical protein